MIQYHEIKSEKLRVITSNLGAHLISVFAEDENGKEKDMVLGYDNIEDSLNDDGCIGAIVGRVVNRVKDGSFTLDGSSYELSKNLGEHHIHGGFQGFNRKEFDVVEAKDDFVTYHYISPDMEEGYPGTLSMDVTYSVSQDELSIQFYATTDKDTILNPTCHIYFNLSENETTILNHELQIFADHIAEVDAGGIPTGTLKTVEGTAFDFRDFMRIGDHLFDPCPDIAGRGGYDHAFILNKDQEGPDITVKDPVSGSSVSIYTDLPVAQVYTANFLGGAPGKKGIIYENFGGVAIETQYITDSIHIEKEPKVILRKGEEYRSETRYIFKA